MEAVLTRSRPALPAASGVASISDVMTRDASDGALLERVAAGDRAAFDELYRRYTRPVLGLALRRLGDRGRAEDAVQDAFTAVWRSAHSYDASRGEGAAWLYTVARNAIVDRARRRVEPPTEVLEDEPAAGAGPDERAETSWLAWRVHRAIGELPAHEREVIELAYWSELSQSEIAERLHVPLGTVKTRTRTGLARLATLLEDELR